MPNIPSRQASGTGVQPLLTNVAAQSAAVDAQQNEFVTNFANAVYEMETTTQYNNAMAEHQQALLNASVEAEAQTDPNKVFDTFRTAYEPAVSEIVRGISDPQKKADFQLKSRASYESQAVNVKAHQLKRQQAAKQESLRLRLEGMGQSVRANNSDTNMQLQIAELRDMYRQEKIGGMNAEIADIRLHESIAALQEVAILDLITSDRFEDLRVRMGFRAESWTDYDPETDTFKELGSDNSMRLSLSAQANEQADLARADAAAKREARHQRNIRSEQRAIQNKRDQLRAAAMKRQRAVRVAELELKAETNQDWSVEGDGEIVRLMQDGMFGIDPVTGETLSTLDPVKGLQMLTARAKKRNSLADDDGLAASVLPHMDGQEVGLDLLDPKVRKALDIGYKQHVAPIVDQAKANGMDEFAADAMFVEKAHYLYGPVRNKAQVALRNAEGNPGPAASAAVMLVDVADKIGAGEAKKGFTDTEWQLVKNIALNMSITNDPAQSYALAMGQRVNEADTRDVAADKAIKKALRDGETKDAVVQHFHDYLGNSATSDPNVNMSHYAKNGGYPGEALANGPAFAVGQDWEDVVIPDALYEDIARIAAPFAHAAGGVNKMSSATWESIFDTVRGSWAYSRQGDAAPGFRRNPIEAHYPPIPGLGFAPYTEQAHADVGSLLLQFIPRVEGEPLELPARGEATRALVEQYVDSIIVGENVSPRDRLDIIDAMENSYYAVFDPTVVSVGNDPSIGLSVPVRGVAPADAADRIGRVVQGPNRARIFIEDYEGTMRQEKPAYLINVIDAYGDPIPLGALGMLGGDFFGAWQPHPEDIPEFRKAQEERERLEKEEHDNSLDEQETSQGAIDAGLRRSGLPGSDPGKLWLKDYEEAIAYTSDRLQGLV